MKDKEQLIKNIAKAISGLTKTAAKKVIYKEFSETRYSKKGNPYKAPILPFSELRPIMDEHCITVQERIDAGEKGLLRPRQIPRKERHLYANVSNNSKPRAKKVSKLELMQRQIKNVNRTITKLQ